MGQVNNQFDVQGIFTQSAGRTATSDELAHIGTLIGGDNTALSVSAIQSFARQGGLPKQAAAPTTNPQQGQQETGDLISTSDDIVDDENAVSDEIDNISSSQDNVNDSTDKIIDLISSEEERQAKLFEQEKTGILERFAGDEDMLREAQRKETGTFNTGLQRIGGFLGQSASAMGATRNLVERQRIEINSLTAKREEAIRQATNARDSKQFELARLKLEEVKEAEREIERRRQEMFENVLALRDEERKDKRFEFDTQRFELEKTKFQLDVEKTIADLTGSFQGEPTYKAQQDTIKNTLDIAGLTGDFLGEPTLAGKKFILQEAVDRARLTGIFEGDPTLDKLRLDELIRNNKFQNSISSARLELSRKAVAQAKSPITQSMFNELAAKGIDNETALTINSYLATADPLTAIDDLNADLQILGYSETSASKIVDTYVNTITRPSELELLTNFITGSGSSGTGGNSGGATAIEIDDELSGE